MKRKFLNEVRFGRQKHTVPVTSLSSDILDPQDLIESIVSDDPLSKSAKEMGQLVNQREGEWWKTGGFHSATFTAASSVACVSEVQSILKKEDEKEGDGIHAPKIDNEKESELEHFECGSDLCDGCDAISPSSLCKEPIHSDSTIVVDSSCSQVSHLKPAKNLTSCHIDDSVRTDSARTDLMVGGTDHHQLDHHQQCQSITPSVVPFGDTDLLHMYDFARESMDYAPHPNIKFDENCYQRYCERASIPIPPVPADFSYNVFYGHSKPTAWDSVSGESVEEMGGDCDCIGCQWVRESERGRHFHSCSSSSSSSSFEFFSSFFLSLFSSLFSSCAIAVCLDSIPSEL
eukprot:gnl/Carplike_NY0171/2823_a3791_318.p1 GENE.gnl/Carplike_NY0171/2823_a3791_318~~gnl/Carplike_NY0171/2823_a3791_318.p1  ORF type:complete len:369 (+),score=104.39 gnl/Carplike_NY0171/2823_a3791_318:73-1107(+)